MRNIARFLFRILFFCASCRKRRLPGARSGGRYTRLVPESLGALILKWVWDKAEAMHHTRFCLAIEKVLFHFLEGDFLDCDVHALHILSDEFRHPRIAGDFAQLVRIKRQTFFEAFEAREIAIEK